MGKKEEVTKAQPTQYFPPVVAVLGHVDHGKTTLLDAIRKSNIAALETGGITQKIGASGVEVMHDGQRRRITFIDTPGHQTFSQMRSRGASVADIGLLIVSAVDGVMPQTKESITVLKQANIPIIVVFTKSDLPDKNIEKTKQQVIKEGILLEGLGGDVPYIEVSAKINKNIHELLELILLVFELHQEMFAKHLKEAQFLGIIIESKLDQKAGPRATVVIKNGTIHVKDEIIAESIEGKVRQLLNDQGKQVPGATIGEAIEILGFEKVPPVGSIVAKKGTDTQVAVVQNQAPVSSNTSLHHDEHKLSIVLVADSFGSLEAIINSLPKEIIVIAKKTGEITPSDIFLAKSTKSLVIGFNAKILPDIQNIARTEKVLLKNYTIIYELLDEVKDVMEGKALAEQEEVFGKAKVLASFPFEKTKVLGIVVLEGRVAKGDKARLMRGDLIVGESNIVSVRQGKNQISKIEEKSEGGIIISPLLDFVTSDMLICHR
ncbi:MAG: GTP-binding protein [Candidatus Levyibacteriota bacterium]|nr:MAG: GTP-binding protein [Candidatus Levybacteria bacterium]